MEYKKTKIYKIWSPKGDKIYIGSTCQDLLSQRMTGHRNKYKQYKKGKNNQLITSFILFDEYDIKNCFIELIESKECNNKDEKNQLEGHYIRTLVCVNKIIMGRTIKEYRKDNKEFYQDYMKNYNENYKEKRKILYNENKEIIKKKYICECGSEIQNCEKLRHLKTKKHIKFIENK